MKLQMFSVMLENGWRGRINPNKLLEGERNGS